MIAAALVLLVLFGALLGARQARASKLLKTPYARCDDCGRASPVLSVRYFRNTGMVVMFRMETYEAELCRSCSTARFLKMTVWTMALGWWGFISFFVNFLFVANNIAVFLWSQTLPSATVHAAQTASRALNDQREYAQNLLATKDFETVVDVLSRSTGASPDAVAQWLRSLPGNRSSA